MFVTADEDCALEAFELAAVDYLLKPVRAERLAEVDRPDQRTAAGRRTRQPEMITVDLGGITKMIRRDDVTYVQAQGDYARLHTAEASYLIRVPLADLEQQWADAGFIRIHRSYLIALDHVQPHEAARRHGQRHRGRRRTADQPPAPARPCGRSWKSTGSGRTVHDPASASPRPRAPRAQRARGPSDAAADAMPDSRRAASGSGSGSSRRGRPRPSRRAATPSHELAEQSDVGQLFVRSLIRSQLRLGRRGGGRLRA